jgi:hypothetical protein
MHDRPGLPGGAGWEDAVNWQPIETAPRDGTRVLLTNGALMAAGSLVSSVQPETTCDMDRWNVEYPAWRETLPTRVPPPKMHSIPNPRAGQRDYFWRLEGNTALAADAETSDYDGFKHIQNTYEAAT